MQDKRFSVVAIGFLVGTTLSLGSACNVTMDRTADGDTTDVMDDMIGTSSLAVFTDPDDATFSTSDVRDVDGEVVQFNTETSSIIWTDGMTYQDGLWSVSGNLLTDTAFFQVSFGSEGGERRAYITESSTGTVCDVTLFDDDIRVFQTSTPVPQN